MRGKEKDVGMVSAGHRGLAGLLRRARAFEALDARLQPLLPENARGQIRVACVEGETLVLAATSPAWSSRARLEAPRLLEAAADLWPTELRSTRVIVTPLNLEPVTRNP
ncbi:MAG: DUF721 domain-containing protein [Wenzhouxiangella sp.]|nr:MAG: DUF721 domain-containing protein [Wenzhouxiangella sp.]